MESLFNDSVLSDLVLILRNNENEERLYCHKSILANKSQYFRSMLLNFNESKEDLITVETDFIEEDKLVIRSLYEEVEMPENNIEQKLLLFTRCTFYGVNLTRNIEQYFSKIKPLDIEILVEHFDIIPQLSSLLTKYIRLFMVDIPKINDLLDKLFNINKQIVYDIIDTLFEKPCFGSSRVCVERFLSIDNVKVVTIQRLATKEKIYVREITESEKKNYAYLPNINKYGVFLMPHITIVKFMIKYDYYNSMNKIDFESFTKEMKKDIVERCNNIDLVKKIHASY